MCRADRDCLNEQVCVSGTCADVVELVNGALPVSSEAGPASGQPCAYDSDCSEPFACRSGFCGYQCVTARDCAAAESCVAHRCVSPEAAAPLPPPSALCPGMDAGTGDIYCSDSPCPAPTVCRSGRCVCECIRNSDCEEGYECGGNRCRLTGSIGPEGGAFTVGSADSGGPQIDVTIPPTH